VFGGQHHLAGNFCEADIPAIPLSRDSASIAAQALRGLGFGVQFGDYRVGHGLYPSACGDQSRNRTVDFLNTQID